ncbi:hypothetical protein [Actinoallomurus rhizosphaericola]|uniref:hypothetical protein n=1 Tax=Actinoallomurus rhizosphaericola TaxID=2952536 RepID=UPI002090277C|nr:hypothetical protein [Actinoallomurus rhizosphaericola]MCO5991806.1 hypothetical protein [Actinoallomurus rhizosphaericola]
MTTTGSGAPPGEPFGGSAVRPAQNHPRPGTPRRSGRDERRRISERLAEAADAASDGRRVRGVPNSSPWQRSNAVWHRAGIDWSRAEPERRPPAPASVPVAASAAAYPNAASTAQRPTAAAAAVPPAAPPAPAPAPPAAPVPPLAPVPPAAPPGGTVDGEPWAPPARARRLPQVPLRPVAIAAAVVVLLGGGAYALVGTGGDEPKKPAAPVPVAADRLFTPDPAAKTSGRSHALTAVVAAGGAVVAIGSEQGGVYSRAQFLTSADGGRTWQVARVRGADGGDPPPGEYPQFLAGNTGGWAALGVTSQGVVSWTSRDARTWTHAAVVGAFAPGDKINRLVRTGSGFVAVGTGATQGGGTQGVVWTSRDGRSWTRVGPGQLTQQKGGTLIRASSAAAFGDTVVVEGTLRTTETVTKKVKKKKRKVTQTVDQEAFWRSPDSGRTWAPVTIPQGQGSSGDVTALVSTRSGLFAAREGSQTTGSKKHRHTTSYAVIFGSADGQTWAAVGRLGTDGYSHLGALRGADNGLAALVPVGGGKTAVLTSADGKSWQRTGDVPPGRTLTDVAPGTAGAVVTGRTGTSDAYLTVAGVGDVNLGAIPGAVHPELTLTDVVADAGRVMAVGGSNGDAALWSSPDGSAWTRATLPAGTPPRQLADVVHGAAGWLAVGHAGGRPLVLMSADGGSWQAVPGGKTFGGSGLTTVAAAANTGTYVIVGRNGDTSAAAWYSTDLKNWTWAGEAGKGDLHGTGDAPKWTADVAAGPAGFVAVGGQTKNKTAQPAVWTSPDGKKWALSPAAPALPQGAAAGSLTSVVARGGVLVATGVTGAAGVTGPPAAGAPGSAAFAVVSADGGRTWQPVSLPGAGQGTAVTAATVTAHGFVLAGTAGSDVVLWTSPDGRTWRSSRPHGLGLDGLGTQRLAGLTVVGGTLVAVGFTGDASGDVPTLWRTPIP